MRISEWWSRLKGSWNGGDTARVEEELATHLALLEERFRRQGCTEQEAQRRARLDLGGVTQTVEEWQDQSRLRWLDALLSDSKHAARVFARNPLFTLAVTAPLALAIGANTSIFSVMNTLVLKPLPYAKADRIWLIVRRWPNGEVQVSQSGERFAHLVKTCRSFDGLALEEGIAAGFNLGGFGMPEYIEGGRVTRDYFRVLGARPALGRTFSTEEDQPHGPQAVILSHRLWMRRFQGAADVVGRSIQLSGKAYEVVGVMPESFQSIPPVDVWVPAQPSPHSNGNNYNLIARLKDGVSRAQANAEVEASIAAFAAQHRGNQFEQGRGELRDYRTALNAENERPLFLTLAACALILLLSCANAANLLLARTARRERELSLRAALGAGRERLFRQLITESLLLSLLVAILGTSLAKLSLPWLLSVTPLELSGRRVEIDLRVLAFSVAAALITGLLFGAFPAWRSSRRDLVQAMGGGVRTTGAAREGRLRQAMVVVEFSLGCTLLVGALMLLRTLDALNRVDPGFDSNHVLTAQMALNQSETRSQDQTNQIYERVLQRIRSVPGVESAAAASNLPLQRGLNLGFSKLSEGAQGGGHYTDWRYVTPEYQQVLRVPLLQGRWFNPTDSATAPAVAVVNQTLVQRYFPNEEPVGQMITLGDKKADGSPRLLRITGVVKDVKEHSLDEHSDPMIYVPASQVPDAIGRMVHSWFKVSWLIRTRGAAPGLEQALRSAVLEVDPQQPLVSIQPLDAVRGASLARMRFQATLTALFALLAVVLAAAGLGSVMAYAVAERRHEFAVKLALGSAPGALLRAVVRHALMLCAVGLAGGVVLTAFSGKLLSSLLYGVTAYDLVSYGLAAVVLLSAGVLAALLPSLRILRMNPASVLRSE